MFKTPPPVLLYASDDKTSLSIVRRIFWQIGFSVVTTASTMEAITLVCESEIDLLMADYDLPRTNAITFADQLKRRLGDLVPPLVVLADSDGEDIKEGCLRAGAAAVFPKSGPIEAVLKAAVGLVRDPEKRKQVALYSSADPLPRGIDDLTGVPNRRQFIRKLHAESLASYRDQTPCSIIIVWIDNYDRMTDSQGKHRAENAIIQVARLIEGELRSRDSLGRFDEHVFALVLPDTTLAGAISVGQRLRTKLSSTEFGDIDVPVSLTVSVAVTQRPPAAYVSPLKLIDRGLQLAGEATANGGDSVAVDEEISLHPADRVEPKPQSDS